MHNRVEKDNSVFEASSTEELLAAKKIIHTLLKAKKVVKIYLPNNPIYGKTIQELCYCFSKFFHYHTEFRFIIGRDQIIYDNKPVYHNTEKSDNLSLILFKDGLRELSFQNDLSYEEIEEFLKIIAMDFDRDALDDDIVTLLWEKDFNYIQYVAYENYLSDNDDYEANALRQLREKASEPDCYQNAHSNFIRTGEDIRDISIDLLSAEDLKALLNELERDDGKKAAKLVGILFEILHEADMEDDYCSVTNYFKIVIEFLIHKGCFHEVINLQAGLQQAIKSGSVVKNECSENIIQFTGGYEVLKLIGISLDTDHTIEKEDFDKYISFLDNRSIMPLMDILTELQTIRARRMVIDAVIYLAKDNARELLDRLNDPRWYVVRNTIYILRKIGSREVPTHIMKTVKHDDLRVRKESIRYLGELGGDNAISILQNSLKDDDADIRTEALRALGNTASGKAKRAIMKQISDNHFAEKDFTEKKRYFEVLAGWDDADVHSFLAKLMNKRAVWKRAKYYELKACVAYCLGLLGKRTTLPLLNQFRTDENVILREHTCSAIKRIEDG